MKLYYANTLKNLGHPYFVGVQFHPEYLSRPLEPSKPYLGLILAASGQLKPYLESGLCATGATKNVPKNKYLNITSAINIKKVPTMNKLSNLLHNGHAICNGWQQEPCSKGYLSSSL